MSRILIVDDEKSIRITLEAFLKDAGFEVFLAEDGMAALELLKHEPIDVIVTDIILPKITGTKLLKQIRSQSKYVQVILITGEPNLETASEALRHGAYDYLTKPVTKIDIVKSVTQAADAKALIDEKLRLEAENKQHQENLERLVAERTKKLRESESKLIEAQILAGIGDFTWNLTTNEFSGSEGMFRLLQYDLNTEFDMDRINREIHHPDDAERANEWINECIASGKTEFEPNEYRLIRKDGKVIHVQVRVRLEYDNGKPVKFFGTVLDITKLKQYQAEIVKQRDAANLYFDLAGTMLVAINHDGNITRVNRKACSVCGYKEDELIGKSWFEHCIPESQAATIRSVFDRLMKGELTSIEFYENEIFTRTGDHRLIAWQNTMLHDENGKIIGTLSSGEDITERRQAEDALRQYEKIVSSSNDLMSFLDINYTYQAVNESFCRAIMKNRKQIIGHSAQEVLGEEIFLNKLKSTFDDCLAGQKIRLEMKYHLPDGGVRFVDVHYDPYIGNDGEVEGIVVNARDITARKQAEEALRERERLLREAQELSHLGHWSWNVNTGEIQWSEEMYRIYGQDSETFIPSFEKLIELSPLQDEKQRKTELFEEIKKSEEIGSFIQTFLRPDGSIGYYHSTYQGIFDDNGELIAVRGTALDITERKTAEDALRKSEARLQSIFKIAPACIIVAKDRVFTDINDFGCSMLGWSKEELIGQSTRMIYRTGEDYEREGKRIFKDLPEYGIVRLTTKWQRKDGNLIDVLLVITPLEGNDLSKGTISVSLDVTDQKLAENSLRESEKKATKAIERFNLAASVSGIGVWEYDVETDSLIWDDGMFELYQIDPSNFSGKNEAWENTIHPSDIDRINQLMQTSLRSGEEFSATFRIQMPDRQERHITCYARIERNATGNPVRAIGANIDISEQKKIEEALRKSENRLREIIQRVPIGYQSLDANGIIVEVNPAWTEMLGYDRDEILGTSFEKLLAPEERKKFRERYPKFREKGRVHVTRNLLHKNGEIRKVEIDGQTGYDKHGNFKQSHCVLTDVTARMKAEEEKARLSKQVAESRERLEILSRELINIQETERNHIARELHDQIGANLTTLKMTIQSLILDAERREMSKWKELLENQKPLIDSTVEVVRNLALDLRPSILDDFGLVPAIRWYLDRQLEATDVKGEISENNIPENISPHLRTACFRIVQEAVNNALKHAKPNSIDVSLEFDKNSLKIAVCDDGKGFDVELAERNSAKGHSFGVLGMQERVGLLQGTLDISSTPGKGTRITAAFPAEIVFANVQNTDKEREHE